MSFKFDYKCPNCNQTYVGLRDDFGNFIGCEEDGVVIKKCSYCREPLLMTGLLEAKRATKNNPAKIQIAIANTTKNMASGGQNDAASVLSLGMLYLLKGAYENAITRFKQVIDLDPACADAYYYLSIALLGGQKPFVKQIAVIKQIEENLLSAEAFAEGDDEKLAQINYLLAYVKYDFYSRKFLRTMPSYNEVLVKSVAYGLTMEDRIDLFEILKQPRPTGF